MKKSKILFLIVGGVALIGTMAIIMSGGGGSKNIEVDEECKQLCEQANTTCPSLINVLTCESKCDNLSEDAKNHLMNSASCEELSQKPELLSDVIIPKAAMPEQKIATNDCEAACGKYVSACLILVPNATEALFNEGFDSCLVECANWNAQKVECMINAFNCEAMTETCGL